MDSEELVKIIHSHHDTYITNADRRASILITGQLAFLGLFSNALGAALQAGILPTTFLALTVLFGLGAIASAGYIIYPLKSRPAKSYIFWENILNSWVGPKDYSEDVLDLTTDGVRQELAEDIYQLSIVAQSKFRYLRYSLILTGLMLAAAIITVGVTFV